MSSSLLYIVKSTFCISLLYLAFRVILRKDAFFAINRILLLLVITCSTAIPLINLPQFSEPVFPIQRRPAFDQTEVQVQELPVINENRTVTTLSQIPIPEYHEKFPWIKLIQYVYLSGMLVSLLILIHGILSVLLLFRKARCIRMKGFWLFVVKREIPAFSIGAFVFISSDDYKNHGETILAHEQAHIRLLHFFDLMLLETAKIVHWFNPAIYALIRDLKEIHEFQADQQTLHSGIDATQYQLLIIQKGVGPRRFALANSFNHCQIKKRITMMNKSKIGNAWRWKVATFLPLLALLLVFCGRKSGNEPPTNSVQFYDQSFSIDRCEIANESVANISEFEVELIGINPNEGSNADNKTNTRNVIWFSLTSTNNSELAEGEYKYSSKPPQQRNLMTFTGIIHTTKKEVKISAGKIVIKRDGEKIKICYHLKGDTTKIKSEITGSYFGSFNFTDRSTHPDTHPKLTKAQKIKKWDKVMDYSPTLKIEVRRDGNYVANTRFSLYDLVKKLEALKRSNPNNHCQILIEQEKGNGIPYNRFVEIFEVLGIPDPLQKAKDRMKPNEPTK